MDTDLLKTFARIVETGSLTSVAKESRLTQPAVSKRLKQLERELGVRLLERNTHGIRPTEAGERLYQESRVVLERLDQLRTSLTTRGNELTGMLTISGPITLGQKTLAPMMREFRALHPALRISLTLADRAVDLVEDAVDVAVRVGHVRAPDVVARKVATARWVLVATPQYVKKHGAPKKHEELLHHSYLAPDVRDDETLLHPGGQFHFKPNGWLLVTNSTALREVLFQSSAICRMPRWVVQEDLDEGRLVEILPGTGSEPMPVSAVYLGGREAAPKVKAFVSFLAEALPRQPGLDPVSR